MIQSLLDNLIVENPSSLQQNRPQRKTGMVATTIEVIVRHLPQISVQKM
jgi:hypothetical protein